MFIFGKELFIFFGAERGRFLRRKNLFQEAQFELHHLFIIHCFQRIEPLALWFQCLEEWFIFGADDGCEIQVERVQRKRRDGRIRIGIFPSARGAGVVDGQQLDQFQPDLLAPIRQQF